MPYDICVSHLHVMNVMPSLNFDHILKAVCDLLQPDKLTPAAFIENAARTSWFNHQYSLDQILPEPESYKARPQVKTINVQLKTKTISYSDEKYDFFYYVQNQYLVITSKQEGINNHIRLKLLNTANLLKMVQRYMPDLCPNTGKPVKQNSSKIMPDNGKKTVIPASIVVPTAVIKITNAPVNTIVPEPKPDDVVNDPANDVVTDAEPDYEEHGAVATAPPPFDLFQNRVDQYVEGAE